MNYNHLTIEERACITKFKEMKISIREMARLLNRNTSTISRELKRNSYKASINYSVTKYSPIVANKKYKERRKNCHRPTIINVEVKKYIENKIEMNWSPEQIVNYVKKRQKNIPSVSTIYRWISNGYIIQGDSAGNLHILDGKTGQKLNSVTLNANIESSPAVFNNTLVVATRGGSIYGVKIK